MSASIRTQDTRWASAGLTSSRIQRTIVKSSARRGDAKACSCKPELPCWTCPPQPCKPNIFSWGAAVNMTPTEPLCGLFVLLKKSLMLCDRRPQNRHVVSAGGSGNITSETSIVSEPCLLERRHHASGFGIQQTPQDTSLPQKVYSKRSLRIQFCEARIYGQSSSTHRACFTSPSSDASSKSAAPTLAKTLETRLKVYP